MPDDPTLTNLFGQLDDGPRVDVDAVLRRARRRRLPQQIAVGGALSLAVGGIVVASAYGLAPNDATMAGGSSDAAVSELSAPESAADSGLSTLSTDELKRAAADRLNLCEGELADVAPSATGLELTTHFDDAPAGAGIVTGSVTLTNNGSVPIEGTSGIWVSITLSQDGVTKWHTNGAHTDIGRDVALAPGESIDYDATFEPVSCTIADDAAEVFPTDLPALPAGEYQVSAAMDIVIGDNAELVTGPLADITLE